MVIAVPMDPSTPGAIPSPPDGLRRISKSHFKAHALELLLGSVLRFDDPFQPACDDDWVALR